MAPPRGFPSMPDPDHDFDRSPGPGIDPRAASRLQTARRVFTFAVPLIFVIGIWAKTTNNSAIGPYFFAVVVGILIYAFVVWRCPACRRYLGRHADARFCRHCGVLLP
ncbi:MAG TPA: hypothetical protein VEI97_00475 [bacterium]|nr:hypothetical protein [bacterium]